MSPSRTDLSARLAALLPELRERYGVQALHLFGSYARGTQTERSDLDLLVDFEQPPDLYLFVELAQELEAHLGLHVDLVTRRMLKPGLAPRILEDLQPI